MRWLRQKWFWTDPLPPASQYVNVLGTKLQFLFRAPSGVAGNNLLASAWTDSITGTTGPRIAGTPTLGPVASLFGGNAVVQMPATGSFRASFKNPVMSVGESPELFAVFRANSLAVASRDLVDVVNDSGNITLALMTGNNQLEVWVNNSARTIAFTDTTAVHFLSGRRDPSSGNVVFNIDGVDTAGSAVGVVNSTCRRVDICNSGFPFDGSLALCGLVQAPMSVDERANILRIARAEFSF